jgi:hypothetical protein
LVLPKIERASRYARDIDIADVALPDRSFEKCPEQMLAWYHDELWGPIEE